METTAEYDGSILVHARTINDARKVAEETGERTQNYLSSAELWNFLNLVSLSALATRIYYDATIPEKYRIRTQDSVGFLGLSPFVEASRQPEPAGFQQDTAAAVEAATLLFRETIGTRDLRLQQENWIQQDEANAFFGPLRRMAQEKSEDVRRSIAFEAYNNDVMGGKILVGLSDLRNERMLWELSEHVKGSHMSRLVILLPSLVNVFRYFLLSTWSGDLMSLYATNRETERIAVQHRRMVWQMVERELHRLVIKRASGWPARIRRNDSTEQVLPLVGLAALDQAKSGDRPYDLFQIAQDLAKKIDLKSLQKQLVNWQVAYEGGKRPDDIANELRYGIRRLRRQTSLPQPRSFWRPTLHQVTPDILGGAGGAGLTNLVDIIETSLPAPVETFLGFLAGASLARLLWFLGYTLKQRGQSPKYLVSLCHLTEIAKEISTDEVGEKVRMVWHRELLG